ncbi:MAG: FMN-binding protein [Clostridiales bacterium]|nr:FMN-binding protein [Clostridiales bacterium]
MRKRKFSAKLLSGGLSAAVALSVMPVSALAVTGSQVAADGTYTSSAYECISDDEDWEEDYTVTVSLTVEDGVFSDITVTTNDAYDPDVNGTYLTKATTKSNGIVTKLTGEAATEDTISAWDTVSNATITSTAVKEAALEAIVSAPEAGEEEEYVYVTMNVPYDDFFNAVAPDAEQAAEYTDALDGVDVVSFATSKYGIDEDTGVGKRSTSGTAKGTYNDGTAICGVYYAVAMDADTYAALSDSELTEGDDYYFTDLDEEPASYLTLTYEDGTYTFDADTMTVAGQEEAEIADLTYTSTYGDYMFSLMNVAQKGVTDANGASDIQINGESVTIAVEVVEFSDGSSIAIYNVDNIWMGSRYDHEISWFIVGGKGYYKGHNNSANPLNYQYTMTDYTMTGISVITDKGIYEYSCDVDLLPYSSGEYSVEANDGDTEISVIVPDELENPAVTVSYSVGSGRNVTTVYVAEAASIVDGKVALSEAIDAETNGTYTILIESDNYAPKTITLDVPMTDAQRETLNDLVAEAEVILAFAEHSLLSDHVAEAYELLESDDAVYSEAAELIEELEEYIAEAKALVPAGDTFAVRRGNTFYFQEVLTDLSASGDAVSYGKSSYEVLTGDWDGDGVDTLCVRVGNIYCFQDSLTSDAVLAQVSYGRSTDEVLVGDWDGDGADELCVRRGNKYYFQGSYEDTVAVSTVSFGETSDEVLTGDWDGDGFDTLAVRAEGGNTICFQGNITDTAYGSSVNYGTSTDEILAGDWDGDGIDTLAVRRGSKILMQASLTDTTATYGTVSFGKSSDEILVGTWS